MTNDVSKTHPAIDKMAEDWTVIEALLGGTPAMRAAKESLLPRWPSEEQAAYDFRLKTSTLFPAFRRTVSVMAGKPFSKQAVLDKETPEKIASWADDIDMQGVNIHTFCAEMFQEVMGPGLAGILIDAPKQEGGDGKPMTVADQRSQNIRPYWVRVKHRQILGWKTKSENGAVKLMQLRIAESALVDDGGYQQKSVNRVRVLEPGKFEVFEETTDATGKKTWISVENGTTALDFIPYVPLYGFRKEFMIGEPPLRELAYLNVKHWQSQSDQDNIVHVVRVPILFVKGFGESENIVVGASQACKTSNVDADMKFVEHSGSAIGSGKDSLTDLQDQMVQSGAELMVKYAGARTATESANDAEGNKCDLQRIVEGFEDAIDLALDYTAKFIGLDSGGSISLFKDYGAANLSDASAQLIISMQQAGLITKKTALVEQQRRGVISPDIDVDTELTAVSEEGPAPGTLGNDNTQP